MNVRWVRSNAVLLAFLVVVMVAVGVLAVLVVRQQQDQATDNGQVYLQTAPAAGAASRANTPDPANVLTKPDTPSPVGTGETAPVEVPAKGQASDSGDRPVESGKPSREVVGETAPVEGPAKGQVSDSGDRPVKSGKPSREVVGETAPAEAPAKDQASDSRHRDPARAAG
jgi:hypothetical protein